METRRASNRSVGTGARWFPFPYCFKCRLFRFIESPLGDPVGIYSLRSRLSACLSASNPLLQQHVLNVRHLRTICPAPTTLWKRCLGELLTSTNPTWHEIVPTDPSLPEVDAADEPGPPSRAQNNQGKALLPNGFYSTVFFRCPLAATIVSYYPFS